MKIGIISDTHDHKPVIEKALAVFVGSKVDFIIHAGDHVAPTSMEPFQKAAIPMYGVKGNNDGEVYGLKMRYASMKSAEFHSSPYDFVFNGFKVALMHEPFALDALLESSKFDLIVYGHTHRKDIRRNGQCILINPGECCSWLTGTGSIMILNTDSSSVEEIVLN